MKKVTSIRAPFTLCRRVCCCLYWEQREADGQKGRATQAEQVAGSRRCLGRHGYHDTIARSEQGAMASAAGRTTSSTGRSGTFSLVSSRLINFYLGLSTCFCAIPPSTTEHTFRKKFCNFFTLSNSQVSSPRWHPINIHAVVFLL